MKIAAAEVGRGLGRSAEATVIDSIRQPSSAPEQTLVGSHWLHDTVPSLCNARCHRRQPSGSSSVVEIERPTGCGDLSGDRVCCSSLLHAGPLSPALHCSTLPPSHRSQCHPDLAWPLHHAAARSVRGTRTERKRNKTKQKTVQPPRQTSRWCRCRCCQNHWPTHTEQNGGRSFTLRSPRGRWAGLREGAAITAAAAIRRRPASQQGAVSRPPLVARVAVAPSFDHR